MFNGKFIEQFFQALKASHTVFHAQFQHCKNVVFNIHAAKNGRFLRQIPDAEPGAPIHRQAGDIAAINAYPSSLWRDQPSDGVKTGGFS